MTVTCPVVGSEPLCESRWDRACVSHWPAPESADTPTAVNLSARTSPCPLSLAFSPCSSTETEEPEGSRKWERAEAPRGEGEKDAPPCPSTGVQRNVGPCRAVQGSFGFLGLRVSLGTGHCYLLN